MNSNENITKKAKIIVPENWNNKQKGKFWENLVANLLRKRGWSVYGDINFTGMQVDCLAHNPEGHQKAFIECKFKKDPIDSEILDKLLGKAGRLGVTYAYLFSTSPLGGDAKGILYEEEEKLKKDPDKKPKLVFVSSEEIVQIFIDVKCISLPGLSTKNIGRVEIITLLISPDQILWVAEEIKGGEPCRAIIFPTLPQEKVNLQQLSAEFSRLKLWEGLEIVDGTEINNKSEQQIASVLEIDKEVVSQIGVADRIDHYQRPCNPEYFIGRSDLRKNFGDFLTNVRDGQTLTRIVGFSGASGLGKSSLVLRLKADYSQTKKHKNSFYLYHVDVRSAKGPLFVMSAIRSAIQQAIDDGFIEIPGHVVSIESKEQPLFSSSSAKLVIEKLKSSRRVLVIFFDQFEEIFTKESLLCVYESFENFAHEVDSLKENIVLGFCWRTGITMPDGHPAYYLWHRLTNKRIEFEVKDFIQEESSDLLNQFETYLGKRKKLFDQKLKKWLLEYCPGFPWLLKKICSDMYNHALSESEIIPGRRIDIKRLFKKDLETYVTTEKQVACLRYIAKYSPVPMNEVIEKFGITVVNCLEDNRFVIRTGINYTIYWDIFREYILEDKVPIIPLSYRPRNRIHTVLEIFRLVAQEDSKIITLVELIRIAKYKNQTIQSVLWDLQNFGLVTYHVDKREINSIFKNASNEEIANYLAKQLEEHLVIKEITKQLKPGKPMTLWGFQSFLAKAYSLEKNHKKNTIKDYASRMLSWFLFAGLLEKHGYQQIVIPVGEGKQKGKALDCTFSNSTENNEELPLFKILN